ncbi:hypothetical protein N658DRAFT_495208 [Parathielavia hyrcaniae]|uniref:Pathway-specific nitrogen regulator n=1 Tax=Parathielavia hyrcaniae TaxID=113614 RepID=A0AAN6Q451_9PEZI|nr:hypothetical protein N658DRAFT_495208 [Parathielavia hyrcaniae]
MADETPATEMPLSPEEVQEQPAVDLETSEQTITEDTMKDATEAAQDAAAAEAQEHPAPKSDVIPSVNVATEEQQPEAETAVERPDDSSAGEVEEAIQVTGDADEISVGEDTPAPDPSPETEGVRELEGGPEPEPVEGPAADTEPAKAAVTDDELNDPEHSRQYDEGMALEEGVPIPETPLETPADEIQDLTADPDSPQPRSNSTDSNIEEDNCDRRRSFVDRKTSLRTEALIQAAARAVVAKIEKRKSGEAVRNDEDELDHSLLTTGSQESYVLGDDMSSTDVERPSSSRRESSDIHMRHIPSRSISSDDAGDSSSHNEPDDDVFSDRSAQSSVCSFDAHDTDVKTPQAKEHLSRRTSYASSTTHSPRAVSGFSTISGLSQYEDKHFIPTSRETRMPFRTPSEIRAMQMASPTPSVFSGSSPRSSKRLQQQSFSRLSSPTASAQYSPKNRSTPPRLKPRNEAAPLVLLHVTLLPLRWVWGDLVNGLDSLVQGAKALGALDETTTATESHLASFEPSEQLKTLRDAWRELQDRVGDTVLERGILLPHPQNDYEVLEERLLEALELPVRRRARILECGHYLGPANLHTLEEESEDEDEVREGKAEDKKHWCTTCRNEIRCEDLGPGKVFRVKVYASNGLMPAGAWDACWKEMERVDVEVEPIVDLAVQSELERLGALQLEQEEYHRRQELEPEPLPEPEGLAKRAASLEEALRAPSRQQTEHDADAHHTALMTSPPPSAMQLTQSSTSLVRAATPGLYQASVPPAEPIDTSDDRRRRDEERLREIYGDAGSSLVPVPAQLPAPSTQAAVEQHHPPQNQPYPSSHAVTPAHPPMPLLTDGSSPSLRHRNHPSNHQQHHHHDSYDTRSTPPEEDMYASGAANYRHDSAMRDNTASRPSQRSSRPIVLDENSGFVELLLEAFKVLLRDPKNVAIIVLCVFLVVMMKHRPGMGVETGLQVQPGGGAVAPAAAAVGASQVYQYQAEFGREETLAQSMVRPGIGGVEKGDGGGAGEVEESVFVTSTSAEVAVSADGTSQETAQESEVVTVVEGEGGMVEAEQTLEVEFVAADEQVPQPEIVGEGEVRDYWGVADVCALPLLEYPVSLVGEAPLSDEAEVEEAVQGMAEVMPSQFPEEEEESAVLTDSTPVDGADEAPEESQTDAEQQASDIDECTAPTSPSTEDLESPINAPADDDHLPIGDRCEVDLDMDTDTDMDIDEALPATTTSSHFIPGPFVTERKTVRVFETVTETVRVSVVTQTETVSTVVTAVPQTVEETVYETETVRITVSVPVEEQMAAGKVKAKGIKGCKKGWF